MPQLERDLLFLAGAGVQDQPPPPGVTRHIHFNATFGVGCSLNSFPVNIQYIGYVRPGDILAALRPRLGELSIALSAALG